LRSLGTDGERALEKALFEGFPNSIKLRCMSHFRNNLKDQLKDIAMEKKSEIINQVFGYNDGSGVYIEGILDADSDEVFESLYESVRDEWKEISPSFVAWFESKIPMIKESMLANVRKTAGLGSPPVKFYTHSSESNNHVIKQRERYHRAECLLFSRHLLPVQESL